MPKGSYFVGFLNGGERVRPRRYGKRKSLNAVRGLFRAATVRVGFSITQLDDRKVIVMLGAGSVNVRGLKGAMAKFYRGLLGFVSGLDESLWQGTLSKGQTIEMMKGFAGRG